VSTLGKKLVDEAPLIILPSLAASFGLTEAIVMQQLHFLLRDPNNGKKLPDGKRWIFNTYRQWQEMFPFWTEITIKRIFRKLEGMEVIVSCQPEGTISRRKCYRLSDMVYAAFAEEQNDLASASK